MAIEIERKFLVRGEAWRSVATSQASIRQAYLASGERSTTRVRIKNGTDATVTIKSKRAELRRLEVEYPISPLDAEALRSLVVVIQTFPIMGKRTSTTGPAALSFSRPAAGSRK